jgi:hypothetical protein
VNRIPNTVLVRLKHEEKYSLNKRMAGIQEKNNVAARNYVRDKRQRHSY